MPTPVPQAFAGSEKFLWGFVRELVGVAVGPGQRGLRGACLLGGRAGHGGGDHSFSLPAGVCVCVSPQGPCGSPERGLCLHVCAKGWVSRRTWASQDLPTTA